MAKRKKQTGIIANAEWFVRDALGVPVAHSVHTVSCAYDAQARQWQIMIIVGSDTIAVTHYPPIVRNGILGGDVWAM